MKREINIFHIGYSDATVSRMEAGFELLDNTENARPDWYEIWPIVHYLRNTKLNDDALYGFFSPKFRNKTGLGSTELLDFVRANPTAEVCIFSPQPDVHMAFRSVFHGGDKFNPGYLSVAQTVLMAAGVTVDLRAVVMDSRVSVFSNYLIATLRFWRQWLVWIEKLMELAETDVDVAMKQALCSATIYGNGVQRKVFVAEGFASLLCWGGGYRVAALDPFGVPWFSVFSRYRKELVQLDALKMAYRDTGRVQYIDQFDAESGELLNKILTPNLMSGK